MLYEPRPRSSRRTSRRASDEGPSKVGVRGSGSTAPRAARSAAPSDIDPPPPPDVTIDPLRSIALLTPQTESARLWCAANLGPNDSYQPFWPTVVLDPKLLGDILDRMRADGLAVAP